MNKWCIFCVFVTANWNYFCILKGSQILLGLAFVFGIVKLPQGAAVVPHMHSVNGSHGKQHPNKILFAAQGRGNGRSLWLQLPWFCAVKITECHLWCREMKLGLPLWRDELGAQQHRTNVCGVSWAEHLGVLSAVPQTQAVWVKLSGFPAFVSQSLKYTQILILFTEELMCGTVACPDDCSHPRDFLADSL